MILDNLDGSRSTRGRGGQSGPGRWASAATQDAICSIQGIGTYYE